MSKALLRRKLPGCRYVMRLGSGYHFLIIGDRASCSSRAQDTTVTKKIQIIKKPHARLWMCVFILGKSSSPTSRMAVVGKQLPITMSGDDLPAL